jgi:hypothetical protein
MPKPTYQAVVGIDFEGLKPPVRVEPGEAIPEKASAEDIKSLLEQGAVREIPPESETEK